MKSSKKGSSSTQHRHGSKKSGEKGSSVKLDRKSSRGMIYENEELRLRTININAEVERGQSDIRKLRRENEQLRREIWSLRDEYDRLNKRFKAGKYLPDSISEHGQSETNSEDSDSCDTCRDETNINDECGHYSSLAGHQHYDQCTVDGTINYQGDSSLNSDTTSISTEGNENSNTARLRDHLHVNFDHLSIVSEENLSTSDGNIAQPTEFSQHNEQQQLSKQHIYHHDRTAFAVDGLQSTAGMQPPSLIGSLTPVTPVEMVANQLNDLQSIVPPLSYFENIIQHHMDSSTGSNSSTKTGETVIQSNGWDYNIQSPFMHRQCHMSEPSSSISTSTTMSPTHLPNQPLSESSNENSQIQANTKTNISTSSVTDRTPKHFFSPIKPRIKLDTVMTSKSTTPPVAIPHLENMYQNCDSPDIYVNNVLAAPYYPQPLAVLTLPSDVISSSQQSFSEPIYSTAQKKTQCSEQNPIADTNSKNLVNIDQILTELGMISDDILQMRRNKSKSQERLNTTDIVTQHHYPTTTTTNNIVNTLPLHTATTQTQTVTSISSPKCQHMPTDKHRKPYRSEMNLILSYNGTSPVIVPLDKNTTGGTEDSGVQFAEKIMSEQDGSSPTLPQLPTPMAPFPTNFMYLGFDRLNKRHESEGLSLKIPIPLDIPSPSPPPPSTPASVSSSTSPPLMFPVQLSQASKKEIIDDNSGGLKRDQDPPNPVLTISSPDLSILPSSGNNFGVMAPIKRRTFGRLYDGSSCLDITRSFDAGDVNLANNGAKRQTNDTGKDKPTIEGNVNEMSSYESSSGSEVTKQKSSRRVSIACHDPIEALLKLSNQHHERQAQTSSASVDKLDDMIPSLVVNVKHAHSTPNSPHSSRHRGGNTNSAISTNSGSSTLHHHGHHHHHHHHQHSRKLSQESMTDVRGASVANNIVNSSQDNAHQHVTRYKCSRRHSEGTLSSMAGDRGTVGSTAGARVAGISSHHHHHHHHQDSNQETGTSISERNSGSLMSSRESSTSLSMRSQRRKISVSSHTGGKIPWCGCWGNGCL